MKISSPIERSELASQPKLLKKYQSLEQLISELNAREIPSDFAEKCNREIDRLNRISSSDKAFSKELGKKKNGLINSLIKDLKLIPKHYYRRLWMVLGMSAVGVPMGVAFGAALDNMAFLAIGIPIGMTIGLGLGTGMDEKAKKEGRQLNIEHGI